MGRVDTQLRVGHVAQPQLLGRDAEGAARAVKEEHGADTRPDNHPTIFAVGNLNLLGPVQDVDVAILTALDVDADAEAGPAAAERSWRFEVGLTGHDCTLNLFARSGAHAAKREAGQLLCRGRRRHGRSVYALP